MCSGVLREDLGDSTDRLREAPLREVRRRLRAEQPSSLKGFGRVEPGSEETARSLDSVGDFEADSIWMWLGGMGD